MLAFYYAWYDQNTWTSGITSDTPSQPYDSADPAVIERHVLQAQSAGIDALIVSWYGPREADNQTETNLRMLLDAAASHGLRVAVAFETSGPFFPDQSSVVDALRYLLSVHGQHPAYLRYQERPVVFFWRQQRFGLGTWAAIRTQLDPDHASLWIAEGTDISYQGVFDGHYLYSVAWSPDVVHTLTDWGSRVHRYSEQHNVARLWVATVMPGYDDTRSGRTSPFVVGRRGGDYYRETWAAAAASQPDWIVITSFNEWVEGTMIEPSVNYGDLYLNLTRDLAAQFKSRSLPAATLAPIPTQQLVSEDTPTVPPTATLDRLVPRVRAVETVRVRAGPGTEYERLGRLAKGETALAVGKNDAATWWQIQIPQRNDLGWVSAEFVVFTGDEEAVPVTSSSTLTPTAGSPTAATAEATGPALTATTSASSEPTPGPEESLTAGTPSVATPMTTVERSTRAVTPSVTPSRRATAVPHVQPGGAAEGSPTPIPRATATPVPRATATPFSGDAPTVTVPPFITVERTVTAVASASSTPSNTATLTPSATATLMPSTTASATATAVTAPTATSARAVSTTQSAPTAAAIADASSEVSVSLTLTPTPDQSLRATPTGVGRAMPRSDGGDSDGGPLLFLWVGSVSLLGALVLLAAWRRKSRLRD